MKPRVKSIIPAPAWCASKERRQEHMGRFVAAWSVVWSPDRAILLWLIEHTDPATGTATIDPKKLRDVAGLPPTRARTALSRLEASGVVDIEWGEDVEKDPVTVRVLW